MHNNSKQHIHLLEPIAVTLMDWFPEEKSPTPSDHQEGSTLLKNSPPMKEKQHLTSFR